MKPTEKSIATLMNRRRQAVSLFGGLAAVTIMLACSSGAPLSASTPVTLGPAAVQAATPVPAAAEVAKKMPEAAQLPASKLIAYRSRNYGVSFLYPWQYAYRSAKTVAGGNDSLRPKSDGSDGQFTLARIDIPKGFYPDTDFESGYFTLSLNQALDEELCESALAKDGKPATENINGVDFRWVERESGGHGSAEKMRNYAAFVNGTCYELELGVKTSNPDGQARELDPDQVLRRLDGILRTVRIAPAMKDATAQAESATAPAPIAQD
jgi:hypothetical protein